MRSRMLLLLLLLPSCSTPPPLPPDPPPPTQDVPRLALDLPEVVRSSIPLAEFKGRIAAGLADADVVVVLDLSNTMLAASGVDLDQDGTLGIDEPWAREGAKTAISRFKRPPRTWTTDYDDSIISGALATARELIAALEQRRCRVGLITFTGAREHLRIQTPVGSPAAALAALGRIRVRADPTGTDAAGALTRAGEALARAPAVDAPRGSPAVVLLSDGLKSNKDKEALQARIRREAELAAEALAAQGIGVYTLGFGAEEADDPEPMRRIALFGTGRYAHVTRPEDGLLLLTPLVSIAEVPVRNAALAAAPPRALRSFPDGSFDGFVPLAPGENRIEFEVVLDDGRRARAERTLHYEPTATPSVADKALLEALRGRTAETEIAGESQAGARRRSTSIEIRGESR